MNGKHAAISEKPEIVDKLPISKIDFGSESAIDITQKNGKEDANSRKNVDNSVDGSRNLSKNAIKKRARMERLEAVKRERKEQRKKRKAEKRAERLKEVEAKLEKMSEAEREAVDEAKKERVKEFQQQCNDKRLRMQSALAKGSKYEVCIDLGWNDQMAEKERKSLCRQIMYSYNSLRKCVIEGSTYVPLKLTVCGIDHHIEPCMDIAANGWKSWPITVSKTPIETFYEVQPEKRLVYLSHDAKDVLQELNENEVYIIGGIVDRNRLKGATMEKAQKLGIKAARLNLESNITIKHGTKVLTVNHCVEILLHRANGLTWAGAYMQVLPKRKGLDSVEDGKGDVEEKSLCSTNAVDTNHEHGCAIDT